jgi:hypothetical protein
MNTNELRSLQEAYLEVVENQQLDEAEGSYGQTPKATAAYIARATGKGKGKTKSLALKHAIRTTADNNRDKPSSHRSKMTQSDRDYHRGQSENHGRDREGIDYDEFDTGASGPGGKPKGKKLKRQRKTGVSAESYDIYDIILSYLLDEGFAETPEAAKSIMVNMSEEWRDSIFEADSLAAMAARREKRLARQRKQMGTSSTGQDFGHDYGISSAERKKRQQAEFDKFVGKKTKK